MDRIFGLPAHPLVVHLPVAMLPLAAFGVIGMLLRHAWYERYRWVVLFVATIGTIGAFIATSSGEGLQKQIGELEGQDAARAVHDHAEAGDLARAASVIFLIALALWVLVPWFLERRAAGRAAADGPAAAQPSWLRPTLMALAGITALASTYAVIDAGHTGASKAWEDYSDVSLGQ